MSYYAIDTTNELAHHGILGMKWGVRRYQNEDGSLTSAGRIRYYGNSGKARHYKDVMKKATKNYDNSFLNPIGDIKNRKAYKAWVKEDPRNRTGQRAQYELEQATKALGGKKGMADAKYAYEHKRLAKYVNRDGSLTTAGKIRYYGAGGDRKGYYNQIGVKKMERDINRDKNSLTTSEKAGKKYNAKTVAGRIVGNQAWANRDLVKAAIIGRQKDPTKYARKNLANIGKYARRSAFAVATGRPIAGTINAGKMVKEATAGALKAGVKTGARVAANNARAHLAAASLAKNYGTQPGRAKQLARNTTALAKSYVGNTRAYNKAMYSQTNPMANLETAAKRDKAILDFGNKASKKVYDTVNGTTSNKKKKRS